MKQYNFIITFKRRRFIEIDIISQVMLFIALLIFLVAAFNDRAIAVQNAVISFLIILWWLYCLHISRKKDRIPYYRIGLLIATVGFILQPHQNILLIVLYAIAAILEKQVKFSNEVGVDEEGITFNSFPKKMYEWKEINNMLVKEGMLTIDFKNNKLFQKEIESDVSPEIEAELNQYCKEKIDKNKILQG